MPEKRKPWEILGIPMESSLAVIERTYLEKMRTERDVESVMEARRWMMEQTLCGLRWSIC